ncbi:MAG: hypothetical protein HKN42_18240 [Granulosicoccus sp.]|nr:hypothetical protein [Granulosicoccus sp.]
MELYAADSSAEADCCSMAAVTLQESSENTSDTWRMELMNRIKAIDASRIVIHVREPSERLGSQLASLLSALGANRVERRVVDEVPLSNQVRYFHLVDREAGEVVSDALGLVFDEVALREFTDYQPAPSPGLIEIWVR